MSEYSGSFKQAFAQAHSDLGAGDTFRWNGKLYTTDRADGRDLRAERMARESHAESGSGYSGYSGYSGPSYTSHAGCGSGQSSSFYDNWTQSSSFAEQRWRDEEQARAREREREQRRQQRRSAEEFQRQQMRYATPKPEYGLTTTESKMYAQPWYDTVDKHMPSWNSNPSKNVNRDCNDGKECKEAGDCETDDPKFSSKFKVDRVYVIRSRFDWPIVRKFSGLKAAAGLLAHSGLLIKAKNDSWWTLDYSKSNKVQLKHLDKKPDIIKTDYKRKYQKIRIGDREWDKQLFGNAPAKDCDVKWAESKMKELTNKDYNAFGTRGINTETCHKAQERLRKEMGINVEKESFSLRNDPISSEDATMEDFLSECI